MEFIIFNIKLIGIYLITYILCSIFLEIVYRSKFHAFSKLQRLIRRNGKRRLVKGFLYLIFIIFYFKFIGRDDVNLNQMGILLGIGFALINILTKPVKKAKTSHGAKQVI